MPSKLVICHCLEVGIFTAASNAGYFKKSQVTALVFCFFSFRFVFILQILFVCDDTELNPAP